MKSEVVSFQRDNGDVRDRIAAQNCEALIADGGAGGSEENVVTKVPSELLGHALPPRIVRDFLQQQYVRIPNSRRPVDPIEDL